METKPTKPIIEVSSIILSEKDTKTEKLHHQQMAMSELFYDVEKQRDELDGELHKFRNWEFVQDLPPIWRDELAEILKEKLATISELELIEKMRNL